MTARVIKAWVPSVASRQFGLFTSRQAMSEGMTYAQVRHRRTTGRWVRVAGDSLASADLPLDPWLRAQASWLTWPDAVVCLASAASVHRLPVTSEATVHVSVPDHRSPRTNLQTHQLRLPPADIVQIGLALVTTRRRTLFDCIGRLPDHESEALMIWALSRDLLTRDELARTIAERPGRWGNARRRRALTDTENGAFGAGERRLHAILHRAGLTGWSANEKLWDPDGLIGRADVLFATARLVVEIDGLAFHGADRFQKDRARQNRIVNAGYTVLRFTWADLTERPDDVIRQIKLALARSVAQASGRN